MASATFARASADAQPALSRPYKLLLGPSAAGRHSDEKLTSQQRSEGATPSTCRGVKMPPAGPCDSMDQAAVRIIEVGPRDGLQNIKDAIPSETKLELISRLAATGLPAIELTSIVSPRAVPQLADCRTILSDDKVRALQDDTTNGLRFPVLVPNLKGLEIAIEHNVREISIFLSASDGFSRANINCTMEEALTRAQQVALRAQSVGMEIRGYVSCIFEDPFDGPTPIESVVRVVKTLIDAGCYEVSLGDTLGVGTSASISKLLDGLQQAGIPMSKLAGHFHDTYGQAVANIWQAYQCGVRAFDCSVAGLGGCPYCPGATGNAATEDVVFMFEKAGVSTGVDLLQLAKVGCWISHELGVRNSSRAGAALAAKHGLVQDVDHTKTESVRETALIEIQGKTEKPGAAPFQAVLQLVRLAWNARQAMFMG